MEVIVFDCCIVPEPEKVKFIRPLDGQIMIAVGMRHEFECFAEGQPVPQYVWLKDDDIIDEDESFQLSNSTRYLPYQLLTRLMVESQVQ